MRTFLAFILIGLTLTSCRKDEIDVVEGPELNDIYGVFGVVTNLSASQSNVDFAANQTVAFNCELSKITNWKLTITGQTSGAEKIVEGTGKLLNASVFTWRGETTNFPIFKAETCDVMLTFEGESDTLSTTVTIDQPKVNQGFVVADFETGWVGGWSSFIQSGGMMDFNIKTNSAAPQGNSYYNMQGEVNWDWLVGLVNFNAAAYGAATLPISDNADNLYFNALIYGEPGMPNSRVLFQFDEDEDQNGAFNGGTEDQFALEILVTWEGWQLVSIKYSDLTGNGIGGGVHNPNKINAINMLHLADPSSGLAKSKLDYIIFTENAPVSL